MCLYTILPLPVRRLGVQLYEVVGTGAGYYFVLFEERWDGWYGEVVEYGSVCGAGGRRYGGLVECQGEEDFWIGRKIGDGDDDGGEGVG